MSRLVIELTDVQFKALETIFPNPREWAASFVLARAHQRIRDILAEETAARLDRGEGPIESADAFILSEAVQTQAARIALQATELAELAAAEEARVAEEAEARRLGLEAEEAAFDQRVAIAVAAALAAKEGP